MSIDPDASPFNALPPVATGLAAVILGIELLFWLGGAGLIGGPGAIGWRLAAIEDHGFVVAVWDWMIANGRWPPEQLSRLLTYPLIHLGFGHALFVGVFILAMGKFVGEIFAPWAVLLIFFGSGVAGALAYAIVLSDPPPLVGGFPPVYGLIGAYTFILWTGLGRIGTARLQAFQLIAVLTGLQLIFGALFGVAPDWIADLAGFAAGFGLSFLVAPGGWQKLLARLRDR